MKSVTDSLRRNIICIALISAAAVLLLTVGMMLGITVYTSLQYTDKVLETISECNGELENNKEILRSSINEKAPILFNFLVDNKSADEYSSETRYRARFFIVYVSMAQGEPLYTYNLEHIAAVTSKTAAEYTDKVISREKTLGTVEHFRYLNEVGENGGKVVFLDCSDNIYDIISTAENLFICAGCVLTAVFLFALLLSRRAVRPFEAAMQEQKRFITDASHELKTPVAIIAANSEVLRMETGDCKWLDSIDRQTRRMNSLITRLVELTKYDEGSGAVSMCEFCLSDAVLDAASDFESAASAAGASLTVSAEPGLKYKGDEQALRQLTALLCDNAVKYCTEPKTIKVSLRKKNHSIILEVFNTYTEISDKQLLHIFDRFYRTDASRSRNSGGSGIGLSVARSIVDAHKGRIYAKHVKDENGIVITAVLPI